MSAFNPFVIEDVAPNVAVSEFTNQVRYYGGVSGLGGTGPEAKGIVYDFDEDKNEWVAVGTSVTSEDVYTGAGFMDKVKAAVTDAGLPRWAPVAGIAVLGIGGYFIWKAVKRR